ncbi:hypothetical protein BDW02DRAFT_29250 [Decorospora gaudefroyi]|uniref:Phospholipase B-like n=1 Tax=Decorospora gaudefroyi TaxID=184978 RepID=A0A6A5K4Q7_9PLEO|nr:hypothetical protein BDW02DRAFT_29250 [Decorospora gaudefroyi]
MSAIRLGQTFLSIALLALLAVGSAAQTSSRSLSAPTDSADSSATPEAPSSNVSLSTSLPASAVASSPAASQTPVDSEDDQSFTWSDGSCSPEHQDLIVKAFRDANAMTRAAVEAETDHEHDPAFWELFGGRAVGDFTAIKSAFDQVLQGPWSITASCNFDGSVAECTDQRKYGGIGATEAAGQTRKRDEKASLSATLVFCQEFFRFPPLDHRVQMGINHPYYLEARYDLGYFHDNQGRRMRRMKTTPRLTAIRYNFASHAVQLYSHISGFTAAHLGSLGLYETVRGHTMVSMLRGLLRQNIGPTQRPGMRLGIT